MRSIQGAGLLGLILLAGSGVAAAAQEASRGQVVYVPVYSEIPYSEGKRAIPLTATVSVRNTDRQSPITVRQVDYHDASGRRVRSYVTVPRQLAPLSSVEFVVKESDRRGGISACFLVEWASDAPASPPLVEAVMIGTRSAQGISFTTSSRVIEAR